MSFIYEYGRIRNNTRNRKQLTESEEKKMIDIDYLKAKTKEIKKQYKDDKIIQYFCNSIARTKDNFNNIANIATLNDYLKQKYNFIID